VWSSLRECDKDDGPVEGVTEDEDFKLDKPNHICVLRNESYAPEYGQTATRLSPCYLGVRHVPPIVQSLTVLRTVHWECIRKVPFWCHAVPSIGTSVREPRIAVVVHSAYTPPRLEDSIRTMIAARGSSEAGVSSEFLRSSIVQSRVPGHSTRSRLLRHLEYP
jgi:hypothetical protein